MNTDEILTELFQRKKKTAKLKTDIFVIEDGMLVSKDYFIPLSSISSVEIKRPVLKNPVPDVVCLILGILLRIIPFTPISMFGGFLLIYAIILLIIWVISFIRRQFRLLLRLNNGSTIAFSNRSEAFLNDLMLDMRRCFIEQSNSLSVNIDQRRIELNTDQSTGKTIIKDNYIEGDMKVHGSKNERVRYDNKYSAVANKVLSDEELKVLKDLYTQRVDYATPSDPDYKQFVQMKKYCSKGKKAVIIEALKKGGMEFAKASLVGVAKALAESAVPIITRILSLK